MGCHFLLWKHSNGCAKLYTKFCLESVAISGNDQKWRCTIVYICKDTHVAPQLPNKYWLKSVPLHLHFTICNSVQWFCIIFLRFICQKWTSQTLQTIQLPVFTAYSVSIYTYIYIYIDCSEYINRSTLLPYGAITNIFLDAIVVYSEKNDRNFDTYGGPPRW